MLVSILVDSNITFWNGFALEAAQLMEILKEGQEGPNWADSGRQKDY